MKKWADQGNFVKGFRARQRSIILFPSTCLRVNSEKYLHVEIPILNDGFEDSNTQNKRVQSTFFTAYLSQPG